MTDTDGTPRSPVLHMIGKAHLDPVWLWRWQEGCAEAISTCWAAVDRLEENEDFIFTRGEAQLYAWIEEMEPVLFERIRQYIAEGRWVVVNGWWIQPDCNVPSGESIIRQALYGKRYFKSRFGIDVPVGFNVDTFGHTGTMPMLLQHTGSTAYVYGRPAADEMDLERELFTWASADGSEVTAFRLQGAYNTSRRNMQLPEKIPLHYRLSEEAGHSYMLFYGVGNHGGAPTKENLRQIDARIEDGEPLKYSDPTRFFDEMGSGGHPRVEGELQFHAVGCYSVASDLKQLNRRAEAALEMAETAATLATRRMGAAYPRAGFEGMWRKLLFNQFHDTLGGTSLHTACEDSVFELGSVIADAEIALNTAVRRLAGQIAPAVDPMDGTFVVMNLNGADFDGMVEAEPWVDKDVVSPRVLIDPENGRVALQHIDPHGKTPGLQRLAFRAKIPAFGYKVFRFAIDVDGVPAPDMQFGNGVDRLEFATEGYRLLIDPVTGAIAELVNRRTGKPLFSGPAHRGFIAEDGTDTWGHGTHSFPYQGEEMVLASLSLIEEGPVRTTIEVVTRRGATRFSTVIVLPAYDDLPVELRVTLDWQEKGKLFRIAYPFGAANFEYEIPAGWQERPDVGHEVPGLRWVRAETAEQTVVIANDAKYSYAAKDGTLYITAVRSPVFSHHVPIELREGAFLRYMDLGEQSFTLRLYGDDRVSRCRAHALADELTRPPVVTTHVARHGTDGHAGCWLDMETGPSTAITTIKTAEDGDEVILRAVEFDGADGHVSFADATLSVRARGIASLRLCGDILSATDGLET